MAGTARVIVEKQPRTRGEIQFRAGVLVNESYTSLRRILSFEDDLALVRCALELARAMGDDRKARLLDRKFITLNKRKG